jgi:hypothetical protein
MAFGIDDIIGIIGVAIGGGNLISNIIQGSQSNTNATQQNKIAERQLEIQTKNSELNARNAIRDYEKSIADLEASKIQYGIDIRDSESRIDSYDKWLANYSGQYAQEVQSKQAQTDALMASGKESYENFLKAIGYSDALAGATGRVGTGTSQALVTGAIDRKLVDYVGADRTLDANGGLYGSQLTAANMEMGQLKVDLEFQRYEMEQNRVNTLATIGDYQRAIELTDQSIANSRAEITELEKFIEDNFKVGLSAGMPSVGIGLSSTEAVLYTTTNTNGQPPVGVAPTSLPGAVTYPSGTKNNFAAL